MGSFWTDSRNRLKKLSGFSGWSNDFRTAIERTRGSCRGPRIGRSLRFEALEFRALLAQLLVGPLGDFDSIQDAVDHARAGDIIQIAQGTYAESVDLSRMGSAVSSSPGTISLVGADTDVVLAPTAGPAVWNSNTGSCCFTGSITLKRLIFRATDVGAERRANGVHIDGLKGDLIVSDATFSSIVDDALVIARVNGSFEVRNNEFASTGDGGEDTAIVIEDTNGVGFVSGNVFQNVRGTAMKLSLNTGDAAIVIDQNTINGDPAFLASTQNVLSAEISSSVDLSFVNNHVSDVGGSGINIQVRDGGEFHSRVHRSSFVNFGGESAIRVEVHGNSTTNISLVDNVVDAALGDGIVLEAHESARLNAIVKDNLLLLIGDDANDEAIVLSSDTGAAGIVNGLIENNSISDVTSQGIHVKTVGAGGVNISLINNVLSQTNTAGGDASLLVDSTDQASGLIRVRIADNRMIDVGVVGYQVNHLGSQSLRLAGTAITPAAEIEATNQGGSVSVSGQVQLVPPEDHPLPPASIGDFVWRDSDGGGTFDEGEVGEELVELSIAGTDVAGRSVDLRTLSDSTGEYFFSALLPGDYVITIVPPRATAIAAARRGNDPTLDNDFDPQTKTASVQLTDGDRDIDAAILTTWQNPRNAIDVNDDGFVSPIDALLIINDLNANQSRALPLPPPSTAIPPYIDTSGDNFVAPIDVLLVVNALNQPAAPEGEQSGSTAAQSHRAAADAWFAEFESDSRSKKRRRR